MTTANLYNGDDVSGIVLDIGQHSTRVGYAGETAPSTVLPTIAAIHDVNIFVANQDPNQFSKPVQKSTKKYYFDPTEFNVPRSGAEVKTFLHDGIIEDFDLFEQLVTQIYSRYLSTDPSQHPLLFSEPVWNTKNARETVTEIMFEKFKVPALYFAKNAVLSSFSVGYTNALVFDSGAHHTTVSAVHDGKVLQNVVIRTPYGGDCITEICRKRLAEKNLEITPRFKIKSKEKVEPGQTAKWTKRTLPENIHQSWINLKITDEIREYKENALKVFPIKYDHEEAESVTDPLNYEFADGYNIDCSLEDQYFIPEIFFDTKFQSPTSTSLMNGSKGSNQQILPPSISYSDLVWKCVSNCDIDLRPIMLKSIVLTGGNTLLNGFTDRFVNDLTDIAETRNCKLKIAPNNEPDERKFASWIGGSILSSLGTFQQLWISKGEFAEKGKACVDQECH